MFRSPVTPVLQRCTVGATPALPVHLLRYCAMTEEFLTCDLTSSSSSSDPEDTLNAVKETREMDCEQPIFSVLSGGGKPQQAGDTATSPAATTADTESGIFSGECELCVEHESELDWFCGTEHKLICSHCAIVGPCHGHIVTPLATRVTAVRVSVWSSSYSFYNVLTELWPDIGCFLEIFKVNKY